MKTLLLLSTIFMTSCSLFGIQDEKGPKYKVLVRDGDFEIRQYEAYLVAKTTVKGNYDKSSGSAFRILAGYIFGKNKCEKKIAMTSPVEMSENESTKIAMTSPVEMKEGEKGFTMAFSMPRKYQKISELPEPIDKRVIFEKVPAKLVASHRFTWRSNKKKNKKMAKELRQWLSEQKEYKTKDGYSSLGYNPPWTIPFLRRNEVHIELYK